LKLEEEVTWPGETTGVPIIAINEYLNYFRGKSQDNTLNSLWFGNSSQINKKALNIAMKMAA